MSTPHNALQTKLQALVTQQLALRWTPPAMATSLKASLDSVAKLGVTIKLASPTGNGEPPSKGKKTDALSLGVGVSAAAAASLTLGVSLGIGISASASLGLKLVAGLHQAISKTSDLERSLAAFNTEARLQVSSSGVMPPGRRIEQGPVNSSLRALHSQLDDCQSKANAAAAGKPIEPIAAELEHPRMGVWECSLDLDVETAPTGKLKFTLDDLAFTGTVLADHAGTDGVRGKCRVVGGNGHLSHIVAAHSYSGGTGVKVGAVVRDILKACGEDLSDLSDGPTLDKVLPRWQVSGGTAQRALTALAEAVGAAWRVLRDGTVWFGTETWPEVAPEGELITEAWASGHLTLAAEAPNMVPGTVYRGQKVEHVTHSYGRTLRTHIRTEGGSAVNAFAKIAKYGQQIDFSREYPCKVVTQNPDGTLQLLPDDEVMKSRGLDHVPIRYGMPGFKATVKEGARCHLAFAAGDPTRPFVKSWEYDPDKVTLISAFDGGRSFSRVGDIVQSAGPGTVVTFWPVPPGVPAPPNGAVIMGIPYFISFSAVPLTAANLALAAPLFGAVAGGIEKFQG
jgi:hypothetical protein